MQKLLPLILTISSSIGLTQTSVRKCEEKFNTSIIKAANKVSNLYEQKIEDAVTAGNQQEAEHLMKELQNHKQKVRNIVKSVRYNPKDLPGRQAIEKNDEFEPATTKPLLQNRQPAVGTKTAKQTPKFDENQVITFKDRVLEKVLRQSGKFENKPITVSDVNKITRFGDTLISSSTRHDVKDEKPQIRDISDLKYFTALEALDLQYHKICDISVLKELKNLKFVNLTNNRITDLSPLSGLPMLENLYLKYNKPNKLKKLNNVPKLKNFALSHCTNLDLSHLKEFPQLCSLKLSQIKSIDLSFVNDCTKLTTLDIYDSNKVFITKTCSQASKRIRYLNLTNVKLPSKEFIADLKELRYLRLYNCEIKSIDFLKEHKKITYLSLIGNSIDDLAILKTMYENGCFQSSNDVTICLNSNNLKLGEKSKNRQVIDFLVANGVTVHWAVGNRY